MKLFSLILMFFLFFSSYGQKINNDTCFAAYTQLSVEAMNCIYEGSRGNKCDTLGSRGILSAKSIRKTVQSFFLSDYLEKYIFDLKYSSQIFNGKDVLELRNEEIYTFLEVNAESIQGSFRYFIYSSDLNWGAPKRFFKKLPRNLFYELNKNYKKYFVRYLRNLKKRIPWGKIEDMEKGLSMGQFLKAFRYLNNEGCLKFAKKYKQRADWTDFAKEVIASYFEGRLYLE